MMRQICLIVCWLMVGTAIAQEPAGDVIAPIRYNSTVEGELTQRAFFNWWQLGNVNEGDRIRVEMRAQDGLKPLIGVLDPGLNLVARSDEDGPAEANGTASLTYTFERAGRHTIVATRDGNAEGDTAGRYALTLTRLENPNRINPYREVEFRCGERVLTHALSLRLYPATLDDDDEDSRAYRVSVYGFGAFQPVIRAHRSLMRGEHLACTDEAQGALGDAYQLPGVERVTLTDGRRAHSAHLEIADNADEIWLTVGSVDGAPGRFVLVLDGLSVQPRQDRDPLQVIPGPLTRGQTLSVTMLGDNLSSRLDPFMSVTLAETDTFLGECDDAGSRDCDAPRATGFEIAFHEGQTWRGDRLDAGLLLDTADRIAFDLNLASHDGRTEGAYLLIIQGELPPR